MPHGEFDEESEESSEEESDESINFAEVTEVRFDTEVGPMGDRRRTCKIRCVKGKWVGPLCATNEEGKKSCVHFFSFQCICLTSFSIPFASFWK